MPVIIKSDVIREDDVTSGYVGCFDGAIYVNGEKKFPSYEDRLKACHDSEENIIRECDKESINDF